MTRQTNAARILRWTLLGIGLALPTLALVPLGSLWLWQHGLLLYWALAVCLTTITAWGIQRWLLRRPQPIEIEKQKAEPADLLPGADPGWTPAEMTAWRSVRAIADGLDPDAIKNREDALAIARRTVEAVALVMHPDRKDPLLQFTAPEALALIERVATRMNTFLTDAVPLGDRLTVAQIAALWRNRELLDVATKAYDVWRLVRILNPATAATSEIRERLSKEMVAWGKAHVVKRLLARYVEEVGRAAIDLYGGRLRLSPARLDASTTAATASDAAEAAARPAEPVRILIAGQVSTGKSSLLNALAREVAAAVDVLPTTGRFTPYALSREGLDAALLIDSPGLAADAASRTALVQEAATTDLILWVLAATRADRQTDRLAIAAIREHFAGNPHRRQPPMLFILTHIDRLRPFQDWHPPYDLAEAASPKAASIRAAIEAASADLGISGSSVIPVSLATDRPAYNIDALWAAVATVLPDAERARLIRTLRDATATRDWSTLWSQVRSGGRVLLDTLR